MAIADDTDGRFHAGTVRDRARRYINENPRAPVVRALTPQERRRLHYDREEISDSQARVIAVALRPDIFIFDEPHRCVRYVEYGQGEVSYPDNDTCALNALGSPGG